MSWYQAGWLVKNCAPDSLLGLRFVYLRPTFYRLLILQQVFAGKFLFLMAGILGNLGVCVARYLALGDLFTAHLRGLIRYHTTCTRSLFIYCFSVS